MGPFRCCARPLISSSRVGADCVAPRRALKQPSSPSFSFFSVFFFASFLVLLVIRSVGIMAVLIKAIRHPLLRKSQTSKAVTSSLDHSNQGMALGNRCKHSTYTMSRRRGQVRILSPTRTTCATRRNSHRARRSSRPLSFSLFLESSFVIVRCHCSAVC